MDMAISEFTTVMQSAALLLMIFEQKESDTQQICGAFEAYFTEPFELYG
jgi:hypothetical protein